MLAREEAEFNFGPLLKIFSRVINHTYTHTRSNTLSPSMMKKNVPKNSIHYIVMDGEEERGVVLLKMKTGVCQYNKESLQK